MMVYPSIDSAAELLKWSNVAYVAGSVFTLGSAGMVLYEKRAKNEGHALGWVLRTEIVVIIAAFISLAGTVGAITFGTVVSHLKDVDFENYKQSSQLQIANAMQKTAEATASAELARAGVADVKGAISSRVLTLAQRQALGRKVGGTQFVVLDTIGGDPDGLAFANQIRDSLQKGGWKVSVQNGLVFEEDPSGLSINVRKGSPSEARAYALKRILGSAGLTAPIAFSDNIQPDAVEITVGLKAPPAR